MTLVCPPICFGCLRILPSRWVFSFFVFFEFVIFCVVDIFVFASEWEEFGNLYLTLDCFVSAFLAMTSVLLLAMTVCFFYSVVVGSVVGFVTTVVGATVGLTSVVIVVSGVGVSVTSTIGEVEGTSLGVDTSV